MTRRKIDLSLATIEWAQDQKPKDYRHILSMISHWEPSPRKDERIADEVIVLFLRDALDVRVKNASIEPRHDTIRIEMRGSLDAKELHRLMNSEIHVDGKIMVFDDLDSDTKTESDCYMGEWNETHYAVIKAIYRTKA